MAQLNAAVVTAKKADDFVDSMGLNIKLDRSQYNNNWSAIKPRFQELGIWHYRDGLKNVNNSSTFRSRYQALYDESGMLGLFIWGPWENQGKTGPEAVGAAKKGPDYVYIISGQNEPDLFWPNNYDNNSSTGKWKEVLDYQNAMYDALKADSATDQIEITSPPLSTYAAASSLGNEGTVKCDKIAWHWYSGQGHPDKNEVSTGISQTKSGLNKTSVPTSDFYTTESGHNSWKTANPGNTNGTAVSERTQMRYNLRILADQFRRGIKRTYLHQLMDLGTSTSSFNNSWGIVKADSNKTPKPAFTAWKEMVSMFKERTWNSSSKTWSIPSFTPGTLDYSITGSTDSVKNLLLQTSDGTFYMLVWVARPSWNSSSDTDTSVNRSINVDFAEAQTNIKRYKFNDATGLRFESTVNSSNGDKRWSFTASDSMSILEIPSATMETVLSSAGDTYIRRNNSTVAGSEGEILVKGESGVGGNERLGLVRFNTSGLNLPINSASLDLTATTLGGNFTFRLLGISESNADEGFNESSLHWNNSAISDNSDDGFINSQTTTLGDFALLSSDTDVSLTSQALTDFVNADSDGKVAFLIQRLSLNSAVSRFASKENSSNPGPALVATSSVIALSPIADAYVRGSSYANDNFGTETGLIVKDNGSNQNFTRKAFLKFDVSSLSGPVSSATLSLIVTDAQDTNGPGDVQIYKVNTDSWGESSITWNNRPANNGIIETFTGIASNDEGREITFDVTDYVNDQISGDGTVSFLLNQPSQQSMVIKFGSREAAASDRPVLAID